MDIGSTIKAARIAKGFTQEALAERVGVKKSAVAKWENGRVSEIKRSNLKKLADALDLRTSQLFGDIEGNPSGVASELASIYKDLDLREFISLYKSLSVQKQQQAKDYLRFLAEQG